MHTCVLCAVPCVLHADLALGTVCVEPHKSPYHHHCRPLPLYWHVRRWFVGVVCVQVVDRCIVLLMLLSYEPLTRDLLLPTGGLRRALKAFDAYPEHAVIAQSLSCLVVSLAVRGPLSHSLSLPCPLLPSTSSPCFLLPFPPIRSCVPFAGVLFTRVLLRAMSTLCLSHPTRPSLVAPSCTFLVTTG